jgi:hypothetical protein
MTKLVPINGFNINLDQMINAFAYFNGTNWGYKLITAPDNAEWTSTDTFSTQGDANTALWVTLDSAREVAPPA